MSKTENTHYVCGAEGMDGETFGGDFLMNVGLDFETYGTLRSKIFVFEKKTKKKISLICSQEELCKRLEKDITNGKRQADVVERSLQRLPLYESLDTI